MAALTKDRNTPLFEGDVFSGPVAAAAVIYAGALVARNAAGDLVPGSTATGLIGVGRAEERVDNTDGAAGALSIRVRPGLFRFANSASADELTKADIGKACWIVDDQTVARTSNTSARSRAGIVRGVDALGVWVELNEALTRVATAAAA